MPVPSEVIVGGQLVRHDVIHEVWGCKACHSTHTFPARREYLERVLGPGIVPKSLPMRGRTLFIA